MKVSTQRRDRCPIGILGYGLPVGGRILVRLTGSCARAHKGSQQGDMTPRAKVGYCPCCAPPTHIAAPSRYQVGEYSAHKARGVQMRTDHGPRAVRYFAGAVYAHDSGYLPSAWDWAAQPLVLKPGALFEGYEEHPAVTPPPSQSDLEGNPEPTVHLSKALPLLLQEIAHRRRHPPTRSCPPGTVSNPAPRRSPRGIPQRRGGFRSVGKSTKSKYEPPPPDAREDIPQFQTSYRPRSSPSHTPRETPSESEARQRATRTRGEFRPSSPYRGTGHAPPSRPTTNTSDWKSHRKQGWREKWETILFPCVLRMSFSPPACHMNRFRASPAILRE